MDEVILRRANRFVGTEECNAKAFEYVAFVYSVGCEREDMSFFMMTSHD